MFSFTAKILSQTNHGPYSPESPVGSALVDLIHLLFYKTENLSFLLDLAKNNGFSELSSCLKPSALRKCLSGLFPLIKREHPSNAAFYRLFASFCQVDVMQSLDTQTEQIKEQLEVISDDLNLFSDSLLRLDCDVEVILKHLNGGHLLALFLLAKHSSPSKQALSILLSSTATTMPLEVLAEAGDLEWLQPEYPKCLAIQLNLKQAQTTKEGSIAYDAYAQILQILESKVSNEQVKIGVLKDLMVALQDSSCLSQEDYAVLIDHVILNVNQLLRKLERCRMLLSLLPSLKDEQQIVRLQETISLLIPQLNDAEERLEMSLALLEAERFGPRLFSVFEWLSNAAVDPVRFYSIKLRYEEVIESPIQVESEPEIFEAELAIEPVEPTEIICQETTPEEPDESTVEDLKKLSVFESIPGDFNFS